MPDRPRIVKRDGAWWIDHGDTHPTRCQSWAEAISVLDRVHRALYWLDAVRHAEDLTKP